MKTMLDITIEYTLKHCSDGRHVEFNDIFNEIESQLKEKWEIESRTKNIEYSTIRTNKVGELYRLLTVDSRFQRNAKGLWTTRLGFE
ncbi:Uncharacterised protein [Mycoplasmopsis maculosa]|uniref:HTH HARE-type domain-containing protein n=1 Tax=Mycoplasmopsis maculosa TaxID=114885 RepID=A0A449B531_9BACT|nr:hypothetical protein [Mycoplasmopsis maculosa]VEU75714.1 Uncharacterised protein [Mycoplasmopsis maculosa]